MLTGILRAILNGMIIVLDNFADIIYSLTNLMKRLRWKLGH